MLRIFSKPTLITSLIITAIITLTFLTRQIDLSTIIDSDTIYLAALFNDIFVSGHHFSSWRLTPAPYFFPDMAAFFVIYSFLKNTFLALMIYSIFQCICLLYLSTKIAFLVTAEKSAVLLTNIFFMLAFAFLAMPLILPYKLILLITFHTGSIINGLAILFFLLTYLNHPKKKHLAAILMLSLLGAASDLLFLIWYIFPLIASGFLFYKSNVIAPQYFKKIAAALIFGCFTGLLLKYALVVDVSKSFVFNRPDFSWEKVNAFSKVYMKIFEKNPLAGVATLAFYASLVWRFISKSTKNKDRFLIAFILLSAIFSILNILINKNAYGIPMDVPYSRYIENFYLFPMLFCWVPFYRLLNKTFFEKTLSIALYATLLVAIFELVHIPFTSYQTSYYPDEIKCIDLNIKNYNAQHNEKIKYGISGYWQAKLTTLFSKENLQVVSYAPNLDRQYIITNPELYKQTYDFAIVAYKSPKLQLDETLIQKLNGVPYSKDYCGSKIALIIYGKNKLKVQHYD